jgi:hypothetical protein
LEYAIFRCQPCRRDYNERTDTPFNKQVSQKRVYVEHAIRGIKIFRIAKEEFRMRSRMYEQVVGCICGLVRLRVQYI